MDVDRPAGWIHAGQDALRLAQGVGEENTGAAGGLVSPPPLVDRGEDRFGRRPAVDRQAKGGLGDKGMAGYGIEWGAGGGGLGLVVAADNPRLAAILHAHLGRAEEVAGGVEGDDHAVDGGRHAVG